MKRASCPSCGAEVLFRSATSILAVCEYCRSTLLRKDLDLENLGRMAELMEDASPVQLGTQGRYRDHDFTVVGRIQLKYEAGLWNEWHLLFDNERTGWLGETPGLCAVTFLVPRPDDCPPFAELSIGRYLSIRNHDFEVANLETVRCIAGEGELPFRVGAGYDSSVADLRGAGNAFATLDYSETPPLCFVGEQLEFASLALRNLRDVSVRGPAAKTQAFQCAKCGAPVAPKAEASVVMSCTSCGSVIDLQDQRHPILYQVALEQGIRPLIPLGSRGLFRERDFEVIGFLQREVRVEGMPYRWREYLLFDQKGGFAWLSEYDGHWNYILPTAHQPVFFRAGGAELAQYEGGRFRHFQDSDATVTYVLGEFYWRVSIGERAKVRDYVAPPRMISAESTEKEALCSVGEYVRGEELSQAFAVDRPFPEPVGVFADQPSPWQGRIRGYWACFGLFIPVLLVLQIVFSLSSSRGEPQRVAMYLNRTTPDAVQISPNFELKGGTGPVEIEAKTDLSNDWIDLNVALVDADKSTSYSGSREISYYQGYEDGSSWTEGSRRASLRFTDVPDGRYYLAVSAQGDAHATNPNPIACVLNVRRGGAGWGNFFLALLALAAWPGLVTMRHHAFETRRWMESDHPPAGAD